MPGYQLWPVDTFVGPPTVTFAETVGLDKWNRDTELPPRLSKRSDWVRVLADETEFVTSPSIVFPETVLLDKWYKELERPRWNAKPNQHLAQHFVDPRLIVWFNENITLDKWFRELERPRWDTKRPLQTHQVDIYGQGFSKPASE